MELILVPLADGALSLGVIKGSCLPRGLQAACLLMGGAVFPHCLLFGLGLLNPDGWGQIFPKWPPLEEIMMVIIPKIFASNVLPPQ